MRVQEERELSTVDDGGRPVAMPEWSEVERIEALARRARAQAMRELVAGAAGALVRHVRNHWVEPARRARQRRADLKFLLGLDQRTLDDIGLQRADLRAASLGLMPFEQAVRQKGAVHMGRVGTVVRMPARPSPDAGPSRDLDAAA